jgi:hypothetical protein
LTYFLFAQVAMPLPHSSWEFWGLLVMVVAGSIPSILAWIEARQAKHIGTQNKAGVEVLKANQAELGDKLDGKLALLLEETKRASGAEGKAMGVDQERAAHADSLHAAGDKARDIIALADDQARKLREGAASESKRVLETAVQTAKQIIEDAKAAKLAAEALPDNRPVIVADVIVSDVKVTDLEAARKIVEKVGGKIPE